ncbi:MAG: hypothetical protein MJ112_07525 [Lachnospiraceae bacterium]|nr:hypothetical protein [Lachnospiraceae bacterium]
MKIKPDIDLSQFNDANGEFTEESKQKLRAYADGYYESLAGKKSAINICVCMLKGQVNQKLEDDRMPSYKAIEKFFATEEFEVAKDYDLELKRFEVATKIFDLEMSLGVDMNIYEQVQYVDDFEKVYRQLTFYFRRIQLSMSKPVQKEILTYIRGKKLSVITVVEILFDCDLGSKERIASKLADLYIEQGMTKQALYILGVAKEHCRSEYRYDLEMQRRKIAESV